MSFIHTITAIASVHPYLSYGLFFLGVVIEGEIMLIFAGVLTHLGVFNLPDMLVVLAGATVAKTVVWYYIGKVLLKYFPTSKLFRFIEHRIHAFLPVFRERPFWSIALSKFIYGVNHFVLIFCGYTKIDFREFVKAEALSSIVWLFLYFSLGLFFSSAAMSWSHDIRQVILIIFLFIFGLLILQKLINLAIEYTEES